MRLLMVFAVYAVALSVALARGGVRSGSFVQTRRRSNRVSRILIIGATGGTGRQLVAQALDRGYEVTAFVRNPASLSTAHPNLKVMVGDVLDCTSVENAMKEQDAVISALGHRRYFGPSKILSEGTRNVVQAMKTHGVSRFICETSMGIGDSAGRMGLYYTFLVIPLILPFYFYDKTRQERIVADSSTNWVIVRPGALTNAKRSGAFRHGRNLGSFLWTARISRTDVAEFMLDQLADDTYSGTAVSVTN